MYLIEHWVRADVCGVVETRFKDDGAQLVEELRSSGLQWFGKDRKGRPGGGLGFLVRTEMRAKVWKVSRSENLLWLQMQGQLFVAVVYIVPNNESTEINDVTLRELLEDITELKERGVVVVLGDLNGRIGEESNCINVGIAGTEVSEVARCSQDQDRPTPMGKKVLGMLNGVDMVVMNGVKERANYTSIQALGNSVIDGRT